MDVFKTKRGVDPNIKKYVDLFKYKNNKIVVKGSNNYLNQLYFSDYDLFTSVQKSKPEILFKNIEDIIYKTSNDENLYFIEIKMQDTDEKKIKFFKPEDIEYNKFLKFYPKLDYIKLDYVVRINNNFFEISCIYSISDKGKIIPDFVERMEKDIKTVIKDGNYFKALKKIFSINSFYNRNNRPINKNIVNKISNFLNSEEYGKQYQIMGILEANKKLLENYNDEKTIKKVIINLKDLNLKPDIKQINKYIKDIYKNINKEAKKIYSSIKEDF
jgi:hypothetical protein